MDQQKGARLRARTFSDVQAHRDSALEFYVYRASAGIATLRA